MRLKDVYFHWLCDLVHDHDGCYNKLLTTLFESEFIFSYSIPLDGDRAYDGINLRYRFGSEKNIEYAVILEELDDVPCSLLEMMIALSIKCEEHIMDDPDVGNRISYWFWGMITSIGLLSMTDLVFDDRETKKIIHRLLHRQYTYDGRGGFFTIKNPPYDLRGVEIWHQMMWYLKDILQEE